MKAISLKEPWLQLIIDGKKTVEFRTWKPKKHNIVGEDLLLCSSKAPDKNAASLLLYSDKPFSFIKHLGKARAIVRVKNIVPATLEQHGKQPGFSFHNNEPEYYSDCYMHYTDIQSKVLAWELEHVRILTNPFPVKGKLGIYEVELPGQKDGSTIYIDFKL